MIPQVLHTIWLGPPLPEEYERHMHDWHRIMPHWEHRHWDEHDIARLLMPLHNQTLWDEAPEVDQHRWRVDIVRLEILHRYGGVYVDTDVQPLRPLDPLTHHECFMARSANAPVLTNAVIGTIARHRFIGACIDQLPASVAQHAGKRTAVAVGPYHVQRTYDTYAHNDVTILPTRYFYPQANTERDRGEAPDLEDSYTWHKWATTRDRVSARVGRRKNGGQERP